MVLRRPNWFGGAQKMAPFLTLSWRGERRLFRRFRVISAVVGLVPDR